MREKNFRSKWDCIDCRTRAPWFFAEWRRSKGNSEYRKHLQVSAFERIVVGVEWFSPSERKGVPCIELSTVVNRPDETNTRSKQLVERVGAKEGPMKRSR